MSYYLAPSLATLRAEINARWPGRDHTSDGWIGDAAHQATASDHNPNGRGSVNAIDVDEDGPDFPTVFAAIRRHPSARYVIYERRLYHRLRGWVSEPYSGDNPHDKHFHLSIDQTREAEQTTRPWGLLEDDMPTAREIVDELLTREVPSGTLGNFTVADWLKGGRMAAREVGYARAELAAATGRDPVDEDAIVAGVLAGLSPERIAAAIPTDMARQVADELAARLAG
ncbi:hypothetical protein [Micromonospora endolithica]|uniref:Uncharacterized protein n=1 Tax=Micromonospora endolithica TaxID=230091 RepID=A0A3A9YR40_9ACTN|nr:hypothetical protein [Micromonospora endolithica]RKN38443.1 hypothetical protein D7223_31045 [Micromonospora endolithica]TWJ23137.1 hypothetical protein JD76_03266 [Micromonospora endolithica]